jgi:predicted transposase/invertase (TIGR01784 family)
LEAYLPSDLLGVLELQTISYQNTSFVSEKLKESFSDIVWQFNTQHHTHVKVCLLLEHKSYKDENVVFQVLEYIAFGYQQQQKNKKALELIVPILYYHGQSVWQLKDLGSHFEKYPIELQKYVPKYKAEFINLREMSNEQISNLKNGMLKSAMLIQRNYFDPEKMIQNINNIMNSLSPYLEKNLSDSIFDYLIQFLEFDKKDLLERLEKIPKELNSKIMSLYDQLISEGMEKGIEKEIEKVISNAFKNQFSIDNIRLITGESIEKINLVLKKHNLI